MSNIGGRVMTGAGNALGAVTSATGSALGVVGETVKSYEMSTVLKLMRFFNMINSIGLMAAGVIMLANIPTCKNTSGCPGPAIAILSFYMVLFGVLLFLYEARMGVAYEQFFRKRFGFLFGAYGRFFFILFLASISVGIVNTSLNLWIVCAIVAAVTFANAILNFFVIRYHPGFQSGEPQQQPGIGDSAPPPPQQFGSAPIRPTPYQPSAGNPFAATIV